MDLIKETYRIQYVDNTYQLVDWTEEQLPRVYDDMLHDDKVTIIDKCIFRLSDIRAIVHIPQEEENEKEEKQQLVVTEMGAYERELYELLVQNGFAEELGNVIGEKGVKE